MPTVTFQKVDLLIFLKASGVAGFQIRPVEHSDAHLTIHNPKGEHVADVNTQCIWVWKPEALEAIKQAATAFEKNCNPDKPVEINCGFTEKEVV